jgi:HEAT repeat protein
MGALIEDLIAHTSGPDRDEALQQLARVEDARVIPFFLSELSGPRAHVAIWALAKFDDDAALAGLVAATSIRAEDIGETYAAFAEQAAASHRLTAAQSLSTSVHPGAHAVLLSMAAHPDDNIRLTVVHALGQDQSPESSAMLRGFRGDASAMVAGEAARYLRER